MTMPGLPPQSNMTSFNPPAYQPFSGPGILSNPMLQMAMAMYLPAQVGQDSFLPQLAPSQHLFDQYQSMQYQNARMQGMAGMQDIDQKAISSRLLGLRSMVTDAPATAMNIQQASNMAGMINHPVARMMMSQMMGPEMMEDIFFGQKGSAENLYQSVARTGFFRKDPLGGERMSGESLGGVTREMFNQMYGDDADMSEMNGLTAGRAGALYEDLFRRGSIPQSLGQMSAADRVKLIGKDLPADDETLTRMARDYSREQLSASDKKLVDDKTFNELSRPQQEEQINAVLESNKTKLQKDFKTIRDYNGDVAGMPSATDIEQLEGFGAAARNVDAGRITKAIKDHTGAVAAVREIFGDSGNPNAPMSQLLTALEALTQNQVGKANPQKIEQSVRELQMAARGAGVGIQGMLGLSAQTAAFGDQLGLDRSFATSSTLVGLRTGEAMRNTGTLNRGFGSITAEKAMVTGAYLEQAATASPTGNMIGAVARIVEENPEKHYNIAPDGTRTPKTPAAAMYEAMKAGKSTFTGKDGKEVDLTAGLQSGNAVGFMQDQLSDEDNAMVQSVIMDHQGNQEYTGRVSNISGLVQRNNIVGDMGLIVGDQLATEKGIDREQANETGRFMADALIEATHSGVAPEERAKKYEEHIKEQMVLAEEAKLDPDMDPAMRRTKAIEKAEARMTATFGDGDERRARLDRARYDGGRLLTEQARAAGLTQYEAKDFFSSAAMEERTRLETKQKARAELMAAYGSSQGSFAGRASDILANMGEGKTVDDVMGTILGIVPKERLEGGMRDGAEAIVRAAAADFKSGDNLKAGRAGAMMRALEAGGGAQLTKGVKAYAESVLGIDPRTATDADAAQVQKLTESLLAGENDKIADILGAKGIDPEEAITAARAFKQMNDTGKGLDAKTDTFSMVDARKKTLDAIAAEANADTEEGRQLKKELEATDEGKEILKLAGSKDQRELKKLGDMTQDAFTELLRTGTAAAERDEGAGKKVKDIVTGATQTAEEAAGAAATATAADGAAGVGDLAAAVTKASPAIDSITKAAEEAAKALGALPAIVALIGPEKVVDAAAVTATAAVGKGVAAAADLASGKTATTPIDGATPADPAELTGTLTLVGLDKVRLNGQSNMLAQTPGNGAGVDPGAVTQMA